MRRRRRLDARPLRLGTGRGGELNTGARRRPATGNGLTEAYRLGADNFEITGSPGPLLWIGARAAVLPLGPDLIYDGVLLTWGCAVDFDCLPANVRVVPGFGDELLTVLDRLEALMGSMAVWEIEDDVELPAPFAEGKALVALQTVAGVVRPTQARSEPHLVSGRMPRRGWPGRRQLSLHFVPIPDAPLATLEHAAQILAVQRGYGNLNAAVEQYTAVLGEPPLALVSCLSRTVSLLTLPWDDDVKKLWRSATAYPDKCDAEFTRSEQQAYDRVVRRFDDLWSYRPHVDQPRS